MQRLLSLVRRCVEDYDMIRPGDRIAVGVSGGKDSLTTLLALARLRSFYPVPFTVEAVTLETGLPGMDFGGVARLCDELSVPYTRIKTEIARIIFEERREKNPCSMCAKMRRGALGAALGEMGIGKVALGHHFDDAVETFYLSLLFEGRLSCFQPVTWLDRSGITQIRPLLYVSESTVRGIARRYGLPVGENPGPANGYTQRQEGRERLRELEGRYPGLRERTFGAMQRLPLPAWEPKEHRRRPLSDAPPPER
jgi:tRNA(Ile)-lysidine synthase TilS/MesJ